VTAVVREQRPSPRRARALPLREAELSRLWAGQLLPPEALQTTDGRRVVVRYRGRAGNGPGPDFRDAVLWIEPEPAAAGQPAAEYGHFSVGDFSIEEQANAQAQLSPSDSTSRAALQLPEAASAESARELPPVSLAAAPATHDGDALAAPSAQQLPIADAQASGWLRGDIELHVRASDFVRHGHATDRAYLRVALHVVFEDDAPVVCLLDGRAVPTVALGRWVQRRAGAIRLSLGGAESYQEPCHTAVARLGDAAVRGVLQDGGVARLREKSARVTSLIGELGAEEALYVALAQALGLTANVEPMARLARALPLAELRALAVASAAPEEAIEAALLGAAGLLDGQATLWAEGERVERLRACWHAFGAPRATGISWDAAPRRPGTGPRERLLALAALLLRTGPPFDATRDQWRALLAGGADPLLRALTVERLAGRDRALELAVNAVLPWLAAVWPDDADLAERVAAIYRALPAPVAYGSTRPLATALRDERGHTLVRGAAAAQGALQLTRHWCTQGGCGRCPLS
jgi:hypothetical protein